MPADSLRPSRCTARPSGSAPRRATGDWRLEVIARGNLVDLLWEIGPLEETAREAGRLADALRAKPAADPDMAIAFANLIGILSEQGRVDEASAAAREALPPMRRARTYFVEEWAYLFWRRGQPDAAARLLGAVDAEATRTGVPLQPNERRLLTAARAALATGLPAAALAGLLAAGAALGQADLLALITEALAAPSDSRRRPRRAPSHAAVDPAPGRRSALVRDPPDHSDLRQTPAARMGL